MGYRESVPLGDTTLDPEAIDLLMGELAERFLSRDYDVLSKNCCTFCSVLSRRLGVGELPAYVMRMPDAGAAIWRASTPQVRSRLRPSDGGFCSQSASLSASSEDQRRQPPPRRQPSRGLKPSISPH